jgi:hypothetical protein
MPGFDSGGPSGAIGHTPQYQCALGLISGTRPRASSTAWLRACTAVGSFGILFGLTHRGRPQAVATCIAPTGHRQVCSWFVMALTFVPFLQLGFCTHHLGLHTCEDGSAQLATAGAPQQLSGIMFGLISLRQTLCSSCHDIHIQLRFSFVVRHLCCA